MFRDGVGRKFAEGEAKKGRGKSREIGGQSVVRVGRRVGVKKLKRKVWWEG
jgi:hypothetical protein